MKKYAGRRGFSLKIGRFGHLKRASGGPQTAALLLQEIARKKREGVNAVE